MTSHYLSPVSAIIERLGAISALKDIKEEAEIADVELAALTRPSAFVVFAGDTQADDDGIPGVSRIVQTYAVCVVVDAPRTDQLSDVAGPLLLAVQESLIGWSPAAGFSPLRYIAALKPEVTPSAIGIYPLIYETVLELQTGNAAQ